MELIDRLELRTGESDTVLLEEILTEATEIYMDCRFPNTANRPEDIEPQYEGLVLRMAVDIYNKIGAEGQRGHSENGIFRTYSGDWVSKDLMAQIVPYCGVVK